MNGTTNAKDSIDLRGYAASVLGEPEKKKSNGVWVFQSPFLEYVQKTPSLCIWKDHYFCFASHEHGDIVDFVKSIKKCSFEKACEILGIEY